MHSRTLINPRLYLPLIMYSLFTFVIVWRTICIVCEFRIVKFRGQHLYLSISLRMHCGRIQQPSLCWWQSEGSLSWALVSRDVCVIWNIQWWFCRWFLYSRYFPAQWFQDICARHRLGFPFPLHLAIVCPYSLLFSITSKEAPHTSRYRILSLHLYNIFA